MGNIKKLRRWYTEKECKALIDWIDSLEIQEVAELKEWFENERPTFLKRFLRRLVK